MLPAGSIALTANTWVPMPRPVYCLGDVHGASAPRSSEQTNVEPDSSEMNVNVAIVSVVNAGGLSVIVASGGSDSRMSQLHSAGSGSTLPALSTDRTRRVCESGARPVYVTGDVHVA